MMDNGRWTMMMMMKMMMVTMDPIQMEGDGMDLT